MCCPSPRPFLAIRPKTTDDPLVRDAYRAGGSEYHLDNPIISPPPCYHKGVKLHYVIRGTGPSVVLLHGFLSDSRYWNDMPNGWQPITASLRLTCQVLAVHLNRAETNILFLLMPRRSLQQLRHSLMRPQWWWAIPWAHSLLANFPSPTPASYGSCCSVICLSTRRAAQAKAALARTGKHYRLTLYSPAGRVLWPLIKLTVPRGRLQPKSMTGFSHHHTHASRTYSLQGVIEAVNGLELLSQLSVPTVLIVGLKDRIVYRQNLTSFTPPKNVTIHYVPTGHHTPLATPQEIISHVP